MSLSFSGEVIRLLPEQGVVLKAYQEDLRKRIIAAKESGQSGALVARRYNVTVRTVERYWKRYVETDSVQPGRLGGYRTSKLAAHDGTLLRWIREKPDLTLVELQRRCAEELQVSVNALWYRLEKLSVSFKKNDARRRTRPA